MKKISISTTNDYFIKNNQPLFLLSDTEWMAFQRLSLAEFEKVVKTRKQQGFNAIQISVLPIPHDNTYGNDDLHPFEIENKEYRFDKINYAYFEHAKKMLEIMKQYDMIPFLHLIWANYIPDTWAAKITPNTVMSLDCIEKLTNYFLDIFEEFNPIYSVSGDTGFESDLVIKYYIKMLDILHKRVPDSLTTLHLKAITDVPEILRKHPQYHFYSYQSGHRATKPDELNGQTQMLHYSNYFLNIAEKKPIVNTEPCYEGHGFGRNNRKCGRYKAFDVRRTALMSLISGSKAGVSYGAHGIWQFYRQGEYFTSTAHSGLPFDWKFAIELPGAYEMGYIKELYEKHSMFCLNPSKAFNCASDTVQMAESDDMIVMYLDYNDEVEILRDLSNYSVEMIALESKKTFTPDFEINNSITKIYLSNYNEDMLIIAKKQGWFQSCFCIIG